MLPMRDEGLQQPSAMPQKKNGTMIVIIISIIVLAVIVCRICYVSGEAKGFNDCWHYIKDEHKRTKR